MKYVCRITNGAESGKLEINALNAAGLNASANRKVANNRGGKGGKEGKGGKGSKKKGEQLLSSMMKGKSQAIMETPQVNV